MSMQNFWGVKEVHYGIVQVVNKIMSSKVEEIQKKIFEFVLAHVFLL